MPETQLSSLPEPIQRGIEQDNGIFEQWIDEIKSMRVSCKKFLCKHIKDRHPSGKLIQNNFLTILVWFTF